MTISKDKITSYARKFLKVNEILAEDENEIIDKVLPEFKNYVNKLVVKEKKEYSNTLFHDEIQDNKLLLSVLIKTVEIDPLKDEAEFVLGYPHILTCYGRLQSYVSLLISYKKIDSHLIPEHHVEKLNKKSEEIADMLRKDYPKTAKLLDKVPEVYLEVVNLRFSDQEFKF